jgi:AcrR family transcriptional regulator
VTRAEKADARRRHLLTTARNLFVEQGFHRTGVAQIAEASGIKVGQIYRDFDSKEDIIAAIVEQDVTEWLQEDVLATAVGQGDAAAIREWTRRFGVVEESIDECRMMSEIFAEAGRNERIAEISRRIDDRVRDSLITALAALVPGGARPPGLVQLADFILAIGMGLMTRRIFTREMDIAALTIHAKKMIDREIDDLASGAMS